MPKRLAKVSEGLCVSCGACTNVCPKEAITIWRGCYAVVNESLCVGCGMCARTCPAGIIEVISSEA